MAFFSYSNIQPINEGINANDGTGDTVRDAFIKAEDNITYISQFLSNSSSIDFLNVSITNLTSSDASIDTLTSDTINVNNLNADVSTFSNIVVSNILPSSSSVDLGSPTQPFGRLYLSGNIVQAGTTQTVDAGQLIVHANAAIGDTKDVGILGNVAHHYLGVNTYAFFGYQFDTNNFVYKITNTDPTRGNAVVYDGIYGGAQLGGLYLSNTTVSTS